MARLQREGESVVLRFCNQPRRKPRNFYNPAPFGREMERPWHSCAGNQHLGGAGIEDGILRGAVAARQALNLQSPVLSGEYSKLRLAFLIDAPQRSPRTQPLTTCRKALSPQLLPLTPHAS